LTEAFVVDASVAVAWVHPSQATQETGAMLDALAKGAGLHVPTLWPLEVANALLVLVRRKKLMEEERQTALRWLRGLPIKIDQECAGLAFAQLLDLAHHNQLSVYDAAYLELAMRRQLSLGCKDGPLRTAAKRAKVPLWR
jgi:predicted nucleic acid-binding protein